MTNPVLSETSTFTLPNSSAKLPVLGLGVFQIDQPDTTQACIWALESGYRHIDTAQLYGNEAEVGRAIAQSLLPRGEIFVTTKIRYPRLGKGKTYQRLLESVQKIDPRDDGYVDLFLIHSPGVVKPKERKEMWLALEKLHVEGKAKAIGVSNYKIEHLEELKVYATIWPPAANQILLHPWNQQRDVVRYCQENGIVLQAFSPLAMGKKMEDLTLVDIAKRCKKSVGQVLIRYSLQKGWAPLPKSGNKARIKENADVFDFEISEKDMAALDALENHQ